MELLVLTKSRKYDNYCVAGLNLENGHWVRLTSYDKRIFHAIDKRRFCYSNGIPVDVLDIVNVKTTDIFPGEDGIVQVENVRIDAYDFTKVGVAELANLKKLCEHYEYIFFNTDGVISVEEIENGEYENLHSLELVKVDRMRLKIRDHLKRTLSAQVTYRGNTHYWMAITDDAFSNKYFDRLAQGENIELESICIVVSLGEPYRGNYYKLISAVYEKDLSKNIQSTECLLKDYFGYRNFKPGQYYVIENIANGKDVLAVMPAGSGKSLCFQLPAIIMDGITIVVSPLISLMNAQVRDLVFNGIHAAYINSSLSFKAAAKVMRRAYTGEFDIIYVASERLDNIDFIEFCKHINISMIAIDEAHCISRRGPEFRPEYLKIFDFINKLPIRPVVSAFTSITSSPVIEDIVNLLNLERPVVYISGHDRPNLYFSVERFQSISNKDKWILNYVISNREQTGIIYCSTGKNVDYLYQLLCGTGIAVGKSHVGMNETDRIENLNNFIKGRARIIVATNEFGIGIDKPDVRYVVHYNIPGSIEDYYQEVGCAGRDGELAECIILYLQSDVADQRYLIYSSYVESETDESTAILAIADDMRRLHIMDSYCRTSKCLHGFILEYFGEETSERCNNCSNCVSKFVEKDIMEAAEKIFRFVSESDINLGIETVIGVMTGQEHIGKVFPYLKSRYGYGALNHMEYEEVEKIINTLIVNGILGVSEDKYHVLYPKEGANEVISGKIRTVLKECVVTDGPRDKILRKEVEGIELRKQGKLNDFTEMTDKDYKKNKMEPFDKSVQFNENSGNEENAEKTKNKSFYLTPEQGKGFNADGVKYISVILKELNELKEDDEMKNLSRKVLYDALEEAGYIEIIALPERKKKAATKKGREVGITTTVYHNAKGLEFDHIRCDENAQKLILEMFINSGN